MSGTENCVLEILQTEDTTMRMEQNINSTAATTASAHYARYDKQKKSRKNAISNNSISEDKDCKKCFHCGYAFEKEHMKSYHAKRHRM